MTRNAASIMFPESCRGRSVVAAVAVRACGHQLFEVARLRLSQPET